MIYNVYKSEEAEDEIKDHGRSGQKLLVKKIASFLLEIKT
jgi:hypothetical protein